MSPGGVLGTMASLSLLFSGVLCLASRSLAASLLSSAAPGLGHVGRHFAPWIESPYAYARGDVDEYHNAVLIHKD